MKKFILITISALIAINVHGQGGHGEGMNNGAGSNVPQINNNPNMPADNIDFSRQQGVPQIGTQVGTTDVKSTNSHNTTNSQPVSHPATGSGSQQKNSHPDTQIQHTKVDGATDDINNNISSQTGRKEDTTGRKRTR